jgi:tetratricopeptide (TPR) repeat protein
MSVITLENNIRFSQSMMWSAQKKYYGEKGIHAWDEDVPFYITSNPFIARDYAQTAIRFMQDWVQKNPSTIDHPFYVLELGCGTGQFSFYFLKYFTEMQKQLQLDKIKLRYVMSDITESAFEFWRSHHALKPFVDAGVLEFITFDLYKKDPLPFTIKNPLVIVANYLFDSVATDIFTAKHGELYESLVTIKTAASNIEDGVPVNWKKVTIDHIEKPILDPYYKNEFDPILFAYRGELADTNFQFPIASLHALKNLQAQSNNQFLLLSTDKGYTNLEELDDCDYPELDFHGSFSVMVNYHAIAEYVKQCGGDSKIQAFRENVVTGVFACGFKLSDLPQLSFASQNMIHGFSPTDYFLIYEYVVEHYKKCSLEVLSSYLNLSAWDPHLFDQISEYFCDLATDGDPEIISYLSHNMHRLIENFYFLSSADDTFFSVGIFFQNINQFEQAIVYYQQSLQYFGQNDVVLFNIGMCLYSLDRNEEAITYLQSALALNADASDAKEWIDTIKNEA